MNGVQRPRRTASRMSFAGLLDSDDSDFEVQDVVMTSAPSLNKRSRRALSDSDEDFASREDSSIRTTPESEKAVVVDVPHASTSRLIEEKRVKLFDRRSTEQASYLCGSQPFVDVPLPPTNVRYAGRPRAAGPSVATGKQTRQSTLASFFRAPLAPTKAASSNTAARKQPVKSESKPSVSSFFAPRSSLKAKKKKSASDDDEDYVDHSVSADEDDMKVESDFEAEEAEPSDEEMLEISGSEASFGESTVKKKGKVRGPVSARKNPGPGKKFASAFRTGREPKKIKHCPDLAQAAQAAKDAESRHANKLWPPISDLNDIYADIVDRMPEALLKPLAETLAGQGRALRVATMCSGTESPLLALNLISRAVEAKWGIKMGIEHVFSCELEPFKQAYIERNFNPPLLFRDVTELGNARAHTAYGALVDVPGDIDLLVAGTSCVDYSGLNNSKKAINEGGESGRTFFGMLKWVERHQPAIVILENVKSAPWDGVCKFFEEADYDSTYSTRFDTKNYYIPQTRQRGYFMATRNTKADYPPNWLNLVTSLQRPASSPIEAFMLPTSDQRIQNSRAKLGHEQGGKSRSTIDWSKCQGRHEEARGFEKLGQARPFTAWEEGGSCVMSHGAWNEFARPQPERVLDLMDITVLRNAGRQEDPHFKSRVWELSQNVDRNIVAPQPGVTGCLTPSGMPFLTSRGGPVTGLEALSLQGLPIDELLLTRESDDQLQNLAGNAMTSTVVGICILSALVLARPDLEADRRDAKEGADRLTESNHRRRRDVAIAGGDQLSAQSQPYNLVSLDKVDMSYLLSRAVASSQLCICEGPAEIRRDIYRCKLCDHTACGTCKSRPTHDFELDQAASDGLRQSPRAFEDHLKGALPMRLTLGGATADVAEGLQKAAGEISGLAAKGGQRWLDRVTTVLTGAEFRFSQLKRQRAWTAEFHSSAARLELALDKNDPHWSVYVEADKSEPAGSTLRKLLQQPVARLRLDPSSASTTLLDAGKQWEVNVPSRLSFKAQVTSHGKQVDTWQASLGLRGEWEGTKQYSQIKVEVRGNAAEESLGEDFISGNYELLSECGQANASLHKRQGDAVSSQLYLFIDAARYGSAKEDSYVFSRELGMLPYPAERKIVANFKAGWKPSAAPRDPTAGDEEHTPEEFEQAMAKYKQKMQDQAEKGELVDGSVCGKWVTLESLRLEPFSVSRGGEDSRISVPTSPVALDLNKTGCEEALSVLYCSAPLTAHADDAVWPSRTDAWTEVDLEHHSTKTFAMLSWLMERVPEVSAWDDWMKASYDAQHSSCAICAPSPPSIQWLKRGNKPPIPIENEREAGPYEQALKNRPFPFLLQLRTEAQKGIARVRIAVNASTLMHRALSRLPCRNKDADLPCLDWRLTRVNPTLTQFNLPEYHLSSNRHDPEAANPATFKLELRKEQKRSLAWMLQQEAKEIAPFVEEEVSEDSLPALEWCAEGRARQAKVIRGGVIADAVGYGKTAISLALIATQKDKERKEDIEATATIDEGFIGTKATLVIVPPQLCKQWENEVHKFLGKSLSVHVIFSKGDLNKTTIGQLQRVDVVIMSVSVYKSDAYFGTLAAFAAANPIPNREGRFFESALTKSVAALRNRVKELKVGDGGKSLWRSIKDRADFDPAHLTTYKAKKRIVGAQYAREKRLQDDAEDMDDIETAEDAWEQIKKQPISDVWGLKKGLKRWTDLTSPPLEAFAWRRVVIDEFHYIAAEAGRVFSAVRSLTAQATWVLSGTPKTNDFADIRSMAAFLNVHLGVEDDADYTDVTARGRTSRNKSRSDVERFRSFVEVHSPAWHHRRQAIGQTFLDRFVRQNIAEIDEIASIEILKPVRMPAAERACYLELQHTIEALDLRHARTLFRGPAKAKGITSENDRDYRLRTTLGESSSPEEALSRQAAHFVLSSTEKAQNAIEACNLIVEERAEQLAQCKEELAAKLKVAKEQHFLVLMHYGYRDDTKQALVTFAKNAISAKYGDKESKQAVATLLEEADCLAADLTLAKGKQIYPRDQLKEALKRRAVASAIAELQKQKTSAAKQSKAKKGKKPSSSDSEEAEMSDDGAAGPSKADVAAEKKVAAKAIKDMEAELSGKGKSNAEEVQKQAWAQETHIRALVHQLVQLRNETAARQRSLRYFENIRAIQLQKAGDVSGECPGCKQDLVFTKLALSSVCGHLFCIECGRREAYKGKCPESGCNADAKPGSIVSATSLGVENTQVSAFGEKMSQLAHLLRDRTLIPAGDKVILFVQFEGLLEKTAHALTSYGIKFTRVKGNARSRSETLDAYQRGNAPRVLLLDVADESAAGSNLTIANHVIFLSSLVTEDQTTYRSTLQQAKGRCLRFGQTKEVHLWHLLARSTIDEEIFNTREVSKAAGGNQPNNGSGTGATTPVIQSLDAALEARSERQIHLGRQVDTQMDMEEEAAIEKRGGGARAGRRPSTSASAPGAGPRDVPVVDLADDESEEEHGTRFGSRGKKIWGKKKEEMTTMKTTTKAKAPSSSAAPRRKVSGAKTLHYDSDDDGDGDDYEGAYVSADDIDML
ncbi:hypothetical protein BCV69DRAFT_285675 [Microstroma glucosiphilum]|uniref:RING-type domain-containing protein n=1 Tax=Pseudomicrostroma glucosiphilum TaxID=1684307 RepID=A0A316TWB4_9BASI|nr:hypothetical protein BCV69DRAFT_285675 [Pseudomicrostroma glucosiphilum]PWN17792.1 hypothetical protein BCV69DRAFT_285675 [Pseudomicrostroma glucosiphilum]